MSLEKALKEYRDMIYCGECILETVIFEVAIRQAKEHTERANGKVGLEARKGTDNEI